MSTTPVVVDDPAALDDSSGRWDALVPDRDRLGPFPLPCWGRLWWSHLRQPSDDLRVVTIGRGEALVAVAPMYIEAEAPATRLLFLGGREVTDYTVPAAAASEYEAVAHSMLDVAAELDASVECVSVPDDIGFADALDAAATARDLAVERTPTEPAPYLDLPSDMDAYFARLDAKERHELRRKIRRFEREVGPAHLRRADARSVDGDLEQFFGWHRQAHGEKAGFLTASREAFFRALVADFLDRGWLALDILEGGGTPVAAGLSFVMGDTVYLYNSSLDPAYVRDSPGMVLLARLIERSIGDGLGRLDFLKGNERYKFQLGGVPRPLSWVSIGTTNGGRG